MVWKLQPVPRKRFVRNSLAQVVVQLRFHPILKVEDSERLAEFQERVRETFPEFSVREHNVAAVTTAGMAVQVQSEKQFTFTNAKRKSTLSLTRETLAIDERSHEDREQLIREMQLAVDALQGTHKHVSPTRLGVRYINLIDINTISRALNRDIAWSEVVTEPFLRMPPQAQGLDNTQFYTEILSPVEGQGELLLRYGLLPAPGGGYQYRFDADRYFTGPVQLTDIDQLLGEFIGNISSLFRAAAGPALLEWMELETAPPTEINL